jgi:CelD/BcsL family acetyltransferase involved in cellulose biosynthesis
MQIEVITDLHDIKRLEQQWRNLSNRAAKHHYFQAFDWLWPWCRDIGVSKGNRLFLVTGWDADRLVLVWPLFISNFKGWRLLQWMGAGISDYCDVLVEQDYQRPEILAAAWQRITSQAAADVMLLDHVREDAWVIPWLEKEMAAPYHTRRCPYLTCNQWPDWETYYQHIKKKVRQEQARRWRRLTQKGNLACKIISTEDEVLKLLPVCLKHKLIRMRSTNRTGFYDFNSYQQFIRSAATQAHRAGTLKMAILSLDDRIIASLLGFVYHNVFYYYMSAMNQSWCQYGPGKLLQENLLKYCFTQGIEVFDFLTGNEDYKSIWAQKEVLTYSFAQPLSNWGKLYYLWITSSLRLRFKRIYGQMPLKIRKSIKRIYLD